MRRNIKQKINEEDYVTRTWPNDVIEFNVKSSEQFKLLFFYFITINIVFYFDQLQQERFNTQSSN